MQKSKNILLLITKPDVYKNPASDTFIVFGETKVEDSSEQVQMAAAVQFQAPEVPTVGVTNSAKSMGATIPKEEDDEEVDATGVEEKEFELLTTNTMLSG